MGEATHSPKMAIDSKPVKAMVYRYSLSSSVARALCVTLTTLLLLVGTTALILYVVYRPSEPRFNVLGVAVYNFGNTSSSPSTLQPNIISTGMQFTVASRNPSHRASIYYDHLSAYVSYRGQPITPQVPLQPIFQDTESTVSVSPVLGGENVPVSPEVALGLASDQEFGVVGLRLVLLGRARYKTGPFRSGWTGLYVRCDMMLGIKKGTSGQVPMLGAPNCDVDI